MRNCYCYVKFAVLLMTLDANFAQLNETTRFFDQDAQRHSCWGDNVVPYLLCDNISDRNKYYIKSRINILQRATCVRWIEMSENPGAFTDVVIFQMTTVGNCRVSWTKPYPNQGYVVYVRLLESCFKHHWVMHEMLHVLGFHNEHQRTDRNCFIHVDADAIYYSPYRLMRQEAWVDRYPYDKLSVMHGRTNSIMASKEKGYKDFHDPLGNFEGLPTYMDYHKINYKFCGGRHFCDSSPKTCKDFENAKIAKNCIKYVPWHRNNSLLDLDLDNIGTG